MRSDGPRFLPSTAYRSRFPDPFCANDKMPARHGADTRPLEDSRAGQRPHRAGRRTHPAGSSSGAGQARAGSRPAAQHIAARRARTEARPYTGRGRSAGRPNGTRRWSSPRVCGPASPPGGGRVGHGGGHGLRVLPLCVAKCLPNNRSGCACRPSGLAGCPMGSMGSYGFVGSSVVGSLRRIVSGWLSLPWGTRDCSIAV